MEFLPLPRLEPVPVPGSRCQSFDPKETLWYFKLKPEIADLVVDGSHFRDISNSHQLSQTTRSTRHTPQPIPAFPAASPSRSAHIMSLFCKIQLPPIRRASRALKISNLLQTISFLNKKRGGLAPSFRVSR